MGSFSCLASFSRRLPAVLLITTISWAVPALKDCFGQGKQNRPSLGLVLSGGGACGLAHIGVLKVMEEEGLKPDYISGVSMGSMIGALYSAGYTADSLINLCRHIDWNLITSNRIPLNKIIFTEKDHFYNNLVTLPVTLKKVKLPSGLINGQQLENALSYYLWNYADINNFLNMPVPFMCVATDLITCTKIDISGGYLPDAVRASSTVPYIFTPFPLDSLLLVDGGVLSNFSATETKKMGADILIGSYTGSRYRNAKELETMPEIIAQLGFYTSINDYNIQRKLVNCLIEPYTEDIPATSFESFDTLIMRGYKAALPFRHYFRSLADSLNRFGPPPEIHYFRKSRTYVFDSIRITGNKIFSDAQVKGVLAINPGKPVTRDMLSAKMDLLYGKNWFEKVKYRIIPVKNSLVLEIDCVEKPGSMFYGSVHYDNTLDVGVIARLSFRDLLFNSSQIEINSFIGQLYRINGTYMQFLGSNQRYSLSAQVFADNTYIQKLNLEGTTQGTYCRNVYSGISVNRILGLNSMLGLGIRLENLGYSRDILVGEGKEKFRYNYVAGELTYRFNSLQTWHFPHWGTRADLTLKTTRLYSSAYQSELLSFTNNYLGSSRFFYTFHGSIEKYFPGTARWTFNTGAEFLYMTRSDSISEKNNNFFLGGAESASPRTISAIGFHPFEIPVNRAGSVHLNIDYAIASKVHISLLTGIAGFEKRTGERDFFLLPGIGLSAGYLSIIGPIKAGIMYGYYRKEVYYSRIKGFISIGYSF